MHVAVVLSLRERGGPAVLAQSARYNSGMRRRGPKLIREVQRITSGKGARVAFDPVGGPTIAKLVAALAQRGILFQYGALSPEPTPVPLMDLLAKSLTIRGYILFEVTTDPARLERAKKFVVDGFAAGKLKPVIAKTFTLDQIVEAHRFLESNQQIGKIVVTV
jgi:NADPH:quinone reductase-like Zn-dependent oxidoreductase